MTTNFTPCEITINGLPTKVHPALTVMQACESVNIQIPHFCFHDTLGVAGNCRMCLVEVQPSTKPVPLIASCAVQVSPKMQIFTDTALVKKVREGVLEFLLSTHPLDCPICDQGGECDLQDHSLLFGSDRGRFYETKKAISDKQCGPLIKTVMTRCIQCTRCVRFATDIAGTPILGITGRGAGMEIGFYMDRLFASEISGNVIDLCPVGALTSKPYAYSARPWELTKLNSIDPFDAINSNIEINMRGLDIMRILPRINTKVNGDWIPDKIRFNFDGFSKNMIGAPEINERLSTKYQGINTVSNITLKPSWDFSFFLIQKLLQEPLVQITHSFGVGTSLTESAALKLFFNRLGFEHFSPIESAVVAPTLVSDFRNTFFCETDVAALNQADANSAILLINCNIKATLPILEAKLYQAFCKGASIFVIGPSVVSTYQFKHLGTNLDVLQNIVQGKHWFCKTVLTIKNLTIFCDSKLQANTQVVALLHQFKFILGGSFCTINYLSADNAVIHLKELGIAAGPKRPQRTFSSPKKRTTVQFFWNTVLTNSKIESERTAIKIFIGSNFPASAHRASYDMFLPLANCFENTQKFININGVRQHTTKIFNTGRYQLAELLEALFLFFKTAVDGAHSGSKRPIFLNNTTRRVSIKGPLHNVDTFCYTPKVDSRTLCSNFSVSALDYYTTDIISRSSKTMLTCSKTFNKVKKLVTF